MRIELNQVSKKYGHISVLNDVSFEINSGELVALLGPSGSGKTTLLKMIAGLEIPSRGNIYIDNVNVTKLAPKDRKIGFVFQHYALFKHMDVFENVAFGLRVKSKQDRYSNAKIKEKVRKLLTLVQVEHLERNYPGELSGGQRQRVALARALAVEPQVLLLDEPFSALDANLKQDLRRWLKKLQKETNITIVLVTHDQEEALDIADKIVIINKGCVEQIGKPQEIYHSPASEFIYNFLGHYNVFSAIKDSAGNISIISKKQTLDKKPVRWINKHRIISGLASFFKKDSKKEQLSEYFDVFVRPHDIEISKKSENNIVAEITHLNLAGPFVKLELKSPEYEIINVELSQEAYRENNYKVGDKVYVNARQVTYFE